MEANTQLNERRLADAWEELHAHANNGNPLLADSNRMAFADPEFLFRRETRGIRFQLEMLKPDIGQSAQGIENTIVVYMSDHGEMLGDHGLILKGCRFFDGLVRVPLVMSWPGRSPTWS